MDCVQLCKNRTFFEFSNNLDVIFKKIFKALSYLELEFSALILKSLNLYCNFN